MVPAEEPPTVVPPAVEPAPQSAATCAYPILCCSPRHLGLIPSAGVESESAAPDAGHVAAPVAVAVAALPMAEALLSEPTSPSLLDL